jgi:hypothetical protein
MLALWACIRVAGVARAIEWARVTPRDRVLAEFAAIMLARQWPEDFNALRYWHSYGGAGRGGAISDWEFQVWIDWLIRDGELRRGQIAPRDVYTNELNPYAR